MENFIEYSMPYKLTLADQFKRGFFTALLLFAGAVSIVFFMPIALILGLILCAGFCYLAYRVFISYKYELEYTLLENEISFARVINKERRKELLVADIAETERYGLYNGQPAEGMRTVSLVFNQGELSVYYWITRNKKGERVRLLFQPNEAILGVFEVRARGKKQ